MPRRAAVEYASIGARQHSEAVDVSTLYQPAGLITYPGERGASTETKTPGQRRERERLALLEAQIAQTCYELSRLRAEYRRIRGRLAVLEETGLVPQPMPSSLEQAIQSTKP